MGGFIRIFVKILFLSMVLSFYLPLLARAELHEGDRAPIFTAKDQDDKIVSTNTLSGKWVVLYFYPKDDTPGCTIEAKQFTDLYQDFLENNVSVYGISMDTRESHCDFRDKYELQIPLIPDMDKKIMSLFGVDVSNGIASRDTIVIDPSGTIAKVYRRVKPSGHPKDVLDFIKVASE